MNAREMQRAFVIELETAGYDPKLFSEDVFYYLNKGQDEFIDESFLTFEQNQVVIDALQPLVVNSFSINALFGGIVSEDIAFDRALLPDNYDHLLASRTKLIYGSLFNYKIVEGKRVPVDPNRGITSIRSNRFAQIDDLYRMLDDPFNTTKFNNPLTTIGGNFIHVYTDGTFLADEVIIDYLRKARTIDLNDGDCELPESTHQEIVERGVTLYLKNKQK